jgi:hypothetical protein
MAVSQGGPTRKDTYTIHVKVGGADLGVFDKMTGGNLDSDEFQYSPGGMVDPISLGGKRKPANFTVSRLYRLARDHNRMQFLLNHVGKGEVIVLKQPMDIDGNVFGDPLVHKGTLKNVQAPEVDSESSDAGLLELEVTPNGPPSLGGGGS